MSYHNYVEHRADLVGVLLLYRTVGWVPGSITGEKAILTSVWVRFQLSIMRNLGSYWFVAVIPVYEVNIGWGIRRADPRKWLLSWNSITGWDAGLIPVRENFPVSVQDRCQLRIVRNLDCYWSVAERERERERERGQLIKRFHIRLPALSWFFSSGDLCTYAAANVHGAISYG